MNDIEVVYQVVKPMALSQKVSMKIVEQVVCKFFGCNSFELLNRSRKREYMDRKQLFHYLCHKYTDEYLGAIGRYKGYDYGHSNIINSIKKVEDHIATEPDFKAKVDKIKKRLHQIQVSLMMDEEDINELTQSISTEILTCSSETEVKAVLRKYLDLV